jgi:hypothetical protein
MREEYLQMPADGLRSARSVLLDWNISSRIVNLHRRQLEGRPLNLGAAETTRLRHLASSIPPGSSVISVFSAAEPETRREIRGPNQDRYNARADIATFYLGDGKDYLLHLLDGGESGGLVIESEDESVDAWIAWLRSWFMVSYSALLQAIVIHKEAHATPEERIERYRFWLERELQVSPSREAWIGFSLLAGNGDSPDRARRFLKLDSSSDICRHVWGATWDLMYSRLPTMFSQSLFQRHVDLPVVFMTDDEALVKVLEHLTPSVGIENAKGIEFTGDELHVDGLHPRVQPIVRAYMDRERRRVLMRSEGMTPKVMRRAARLAQLAERKLRQ